MLELFFVMENFIKVKEEKIEDNYGEFFIEPLEPGYGHTLGNSLRRVLLTSIPGAAIVSVKISGVRHKFSTIPGLRENVVDLLLNIKGLSVRLSGSREKGTIKLSVKGPKEIKASDLSPSEDVEIVNADHYIGSLSDSKSKLDMELAVERGTGYILAEDALRESSTGVIPTDAIFTPVTRVEYEVSNTRVGRQTNLDKLLIKIWTNGGVSPREALNKASKTLSSYFSQIYEPVSLSSEETTIKPSVSDSARNLTVDELDLPTRIYNSLRNGNIETIGDLLDTPKKELMSMRNMGGKSISIIEEKLKEKDIELTI